MSIERPYPTNQELKRLRQVFEKVKYTPGLEVDLANYALDATGGFNRMYSPFASEETIKQLLETFEKEYVPQNAIEVFGLNRRKEVISEWQTIDSNVVFGKVRIYESCQPKTWYLRNTEKKQNIVTRTLRKLRKTS